MVNSNVTIPAGDPVDSDRPTQLRKVTSERRETDSLIQVGFCLPGLNFDRFYQLRLFTVGARRTEDRSGTDRIQPRRKPQKQGGWAEFGIAQSRQQNQRTEPGELRQLGGDRRPRTTRSHLLWQGPFQSSPTNAPTRRYHSRTLICPSLDTGAFSISPALYQSFNVPPDPCGPTAACCKLASGSLSPLPTDFGEMSRINTCVSLSHGMLLSVVVDMELMHLDGWRSC